MKFIFLDIDGVLNNNKSPKTSKAVITFDAFNMKNLRRLVDLTDAKIVLISSYKDCWQKGCNGGSVIGKTIDDAFFNYGLTIYDKTETVGDFNCRGKGIKQYVEEHETESFVIIDDSESDYKKEGFSDKWVRPNGESGGLIKPLALQAIKILGDIENEKS